MKNNSVSKKKITAKTLHKHLCPLYLSLAGVLSLNAEAATPPDSRQQNGPSMGQTANGTPMVNIADPNGKGVSLNKFDQFNVDQQGMVLNNSMQDGVTKIGGYAIKNAQLQQEASAIISEVTGAKASYINGTMEVFGKKADIIIANENGISVNGATTINANGLTLSTGKVQMKDDGGYQLSVDKGNVAITGKGISTEGLSYFDVISRSAQLQGEVVGTADTKIVAGLNNYDLDTRSHTVRSKGNGETPAVAIDGSTLGSMYGGKIQLISTETGAGVRHAGGIIASRDIEINADGDISVTTLHSDKGITLSGKNIALNKSADGKGGTEAQNDIVIKALAGAAISNDLLSHSGTIRIDASSLVQNAAALITESTSKTAVPAIQINVAGRYTLTGALKALDANGNVISGGVVTQKNGDFVVLVNGTETAFSSIVSDAELVAHSGDIAVSAQSMFSSGVVMAKKGTLQITLQDAFENSGSISATGNISIASGSMKNKGTLYTSGTQTLTIGSFVENEGRLFADKGLVMRASALNNAGNIGAAVGEVQLALSGNMNNSGTISGDDASLSLDVDGNLDNSGNIVSNKNDVTVTAKGKSVKNRGKVEGRNVAITASSADAELANSGSISARQQLQASAAKLSNNGGQIASAGDMTLSVTKQMVNSNGGEAITEGALRIQGANGATLQNESAGWLQGASVNIDGMSSLTNISDAVLLATGELKAGNLDTLTNQGATIQAGTLDLANIGTLNNTGDGTLYASESLTLSGINTLNNDASLIMSDGTLSLGKIDTLNNSNGASLYGQNTVTLSDINTINNTTASAIQSGTTLAIHQVKILNNTGEATIASEGDIQLNNVTTVNNSANMVSGTQFVITNGDTLKNEGVIQAGTDLIIKNLRSLVNQGSDHFLMALENIAFSDIDSLLNTDRGVISAGMNTVLNAIGVLTNTAASVIQAQDGKVDIQTDTLTNSGTAMSPDGEEEGAAIVAGGDVVINANTVNNTDSAAIASSDGNLTLNVEKALNNTLGAMLAAGSNTVLNVKNGTVNNVNASQIVGNTVSINSQTLNNTSGSLISADNALNIAATHIDNKQGILESALTMALDIVDSIYLTDDNNDLRAGKSLNIKTHGAFTNDSQMEAIGDLTIQANNDFVNNKSIVTGGNLNVTANNITNSEGTLLWTLGNMSLDARNGTFVNKMMGNVLSMGDMSIIAKEIWNYAAIIRAEKDINLDAETIKNESTYTGGDITNTMIQHAYGRYDTIDNVTTKVHVISWIRIPLVTSDIALDKLGEITAGGSININQRDIYDTHEVINSGGLIQAGKDITITGNLYNSPNSVSESMYDYLNLPLSEPIELSYSWGVIDGKHEANLRFNTVYQYLDYLFGNGSPSSRSGTSTVEDDIPTKERYYLSLINAANSSTQLKSMMNKVFGETWMAANYNDLRVDWINMVAKNQSGLKSNMIYFVPLEKGEIAAGRNFTHNGGTLNNGIEAAGDIKENAKISDVDVGDYTIDTTVAGYEIQVNTKTVEELKMGISPMPTIKDLVAIPGMFEISTDFKKANEAAKNGTTYDAPANNIVPIYETRPSMLDQSQFTGSDYFFEQVGYNPDKPVTVIGDNYFTSELIRRQINGAVSSFFSVRDGLEGDALVENLMNNAGSVANSDLGLVVGEALTPEQQASLDKDIVWFVNQTVNGVDVMVPMVYLSQQTLTQLETGDVSSGSAAISAKNDVNVNVDTINNMNGAIQSGGDMTLAAKGDINNVSNGMDAGIHSGGDITMSSSEGDINNSGAAIKADGDINMTAENGDITMTASVGRDEDGNQKIHANDDGVSAGGSIAMTAKSITSNASDITAGEDISLKATDGDVTFNDLHEVRADRSVDSKITGAGSYETIDTTSVSGKSMGSNVSAGGNLTIDSSHDVVMEGGTYSAKNGSIKAENDVILKTSEDVVFEEQSVTSRQFVAEASASGGGETISASYGKNDGTNQSTTSGEYESADSRGESKSAGGRAGRAAVGDSADFRVGMETITDTTTTQTKTNTNASLNFTDSGSIDAGKTADIGGADLSAGKDLTISAEEVASTKYLDESKTTESHKESFVGISGEVHSAVADAIDKKGNLVDKAQSGQDINGGTTTAEALGDVSNVLFNDLAGGSVTLGASTSKTTSTSTATSENITNVNAGNLTINSKKDTTLNGVDIKADEVAINAGGDIDINAAKATTSYGSETTSHKAGLTLDAGVDINSASAGVSFGYSGSKDTDSGNSTSYTNSSIEGNNVKINAGGDMTMSGANITADTADVNVAGDLNINSMQDTKHTEAANANWGASVGVSVSTAVPFALPSVAANGGGGSESYDSATTAKQSGITTKGDLNVQTGGDLNMAGSHLVSENGTGLVDVAGNINAKALEDHIEQDGVYGGGGIGLGTDGLIPTANLYVDTVDEIHYNETQKTTIAVDNVSSKEKNGEINTDKDNMSHITRDEKEAGNNISFIFSDPGLKKKKDKGSYDVDTPSSSSQHRNDTGSYTPKADSATVKDKTHSDTAHSEGVPTVKPSTADDLKPTPKPADGSTKGDDTKVKPVDGETKKDTTPSDTAHSEDVPAVKPSTADELKPAPKPADSDVRTDTTPSDTVHSEDVPAVKPSTADELKPAPKPAPKPADSDVDTTKPAKKWPVPNTNYPTLSPGSATGKTGMDTPKTPAHRKWNGDMTNGVSPSSNGSGTDVKLSPGSSTGQTGMDTPKTPKHLKWNDDMTNGVMPSSDTSGETPTLSPGSSSGKTGMDTPPTPEHKTLDGAMIPPGEWKQLLTDTPVNIYAAVTIEFTKSEIA